MDSQYIYEYYFLQCKERSSNHWSQIIGKAYDEILDCFFPWNSISICKIESVGKWQKRQIHIVE